MIGRTSHHPASGMAELLPDRWKPARDEKPAE